MGDKVDANEDKEKNEFLWGTGKQKQLYNETMDWDQALSKKAQVGVLLPCLSPHILIVAFPILPLSASSAIRKQSQCILGGDYNRNKTGLNLIIFPSETG